MLKCRVKMLIAELCRLRMHFVRCEVVETNYSYKIRRRCEKINNLCCFLV